MRTRAQKITQLETLLSSYETARDELLAGRASSVSVNGRNVQFYDLEWIERELERIERKLRELTYGITVKNRFNSSVAGEETGA